MIFAHLLKDKGKDYYLIKHHSKQPMVLKYPKYGSNRVYMTLTAFLELFKEHGAFERIKQKLIINGINLWR